MSVAEVLGRAYLILVLVVLAVPLLVGLAIVEGPGCLLDRNRRRRALRVLRMPR